jgi:flagella basal body P-ring formation protein FlgA
MKAFVIMLALCGVASADVESTITEQLAPYLPANLGIAQVHVPPALANANPEGIVVEPPSVVMHPGRPSVKITYKKKTFYVPVSLAAMTDVAVVTHAVAAGSVLAAEDVSIEHRALEGAPAPAAQVVGSTALKDLDAGAPIGAHDVTLPAPSPRGTRVSVDIAHGAVHIKGTGTLELATRVGEPATVRLGFNQTVVKGTMIAPGVVVVGDQP